MSAFISASISPLIAGRQMVLGDVFEQIGTVEIAAPSKAQLVATIATSDPLIAAEFQFSDALGVPVVGSLLTTFSPKGETLSTTFLLPAAGLYSFEGRSTKIIGSATCTAAELSVLG